MHRLVHPDALLRAVMLVLFVVMQLTAPWQTQACEIDEFAPAAQVLLAPDAAKDPGEMPGDCCQCDTCTDGCVHATLSFASFGAPEAPLPMGTTSPIMFQAGFTPTDYPVDLRPPIQG